MDMPGQAGRDSPDRRTLWEKMEFKTSNSMRITGEHEAHYREQGHDYWTEETLDGVAGRFPGMDMTPYRVVVPH